jgi:hypothetical protein
MLTMEERSGGIWVLDNVGPLADASRLKRKKARPKPGLSSG